MLKLLFATILQYAALFLWFMLFYVLWSIVIMGGIIAIWGEGAIQDAPMGLIALVVFGGAGLTTAIIDRLTVLPGTGMRRCPACTADIGWLASKCPRCGWHAESRGATHRHQTEEDSPQDEGS
jgi:hypothetical protein